MKKKNRTWRAAALLLALTLVTSCFVGGTFAKYTTTGEATDTARVAKWGVIVEASGSLFDKSYIAVGDGGNGNTPGSETLTVESSSDESVVAPGTKSSASGITFKIDANPEVAYKISAAVPTDKTNKDIFLKAGNWGIMVKVDGLTTGSDVTDYYTLTDNTYSLATGNYQDGTEYYKLIDKVNMENDYYPINWTYNNGDKTATKKKLADVIIDMIGDSGLKVEKNANVEYNKTHVLTWEWPFDANDPADTILGNLQAGSAQGGKVVKKDNNAETYSVPTSETDYNLTVEFNLAVTVEQVD